jgi:hypothetical protein
MKTNMNPVGKFEMRQIINEFDTELINLFGVNMSDAGITRQAAILAYDEVNCARKAAENYGRRLGLVMRASA